MLNKFPVIKNGVEYEVKIMDNDFIKGKNINYLALLI